MRKSRTIAVVLAFFALVGAGSTWSYAQSTHYVGCLDCVEEVPRRCTWWILGPCSEVCEQLDYGESGLSDCIQGEAWEGDIFVCATYGGNCSSTGTEPWPPQPD